MRRCSNRGSRGFTIVEVLVAMTVTGVGLLAVFGALRTANDAADRLREEEGAQLLAEQRMTAVLAKPVDQMGTRQGHEGRFDWEERLVPGVKAGLAEVAVVVRWGHRGQPLAFELVSLRQIE